MQEREYWILGSYRENFPRGTRLCFILGDDRFVRDVGDLGGAEKFSTDVEVVYYHYWGAFALFLGGLLWHVHLQRFDCSKVSSLDAQNHKKHHGGYDSAPSLSLSFFLLLLLLLAILPFEGDTPARACYSWLHVWLHVSVSSLQLFAFPVLVFKLPQARANHFTFTSSAPTTPRFAPSRHASTLFYSGFLEEEESRLSHSI
jgi:hypothetical protein